MPVSAARPRLAWWDLGDRRNRRWSPRRHVQSSICCKVLVCWVGTLTDSVGPPGQCPCLRYSYILGIGRSAWFRWAFVGQMGWPGMNGYAKYYRPYRGLRQPTVRGPPQPVGRLSVRSCCYSAGVLSGDRVSQQHVCGTCSQSVALVSL